MRLIYWDLTTIKNRYQFNGFFIAYCETAITPQLKNLVNYSHIRLKSLITAQIQRQRMHWCHFMAEINNLVFRVDTFFATKT
jgi:hypothetical protein